jgi:hypothetical protein
MKNVGVKNGILFALTAIIFGLVLYFIDKKLFLNPSLRMIMSLVFPIFFARKSILEQRRINEGTIDFQAALKTGFFCLLIGIVAYTIFQNLLLKFDFNLLEEQRDITVASAENLMKKMNASKEILSQYQDLKAEDLVPNFRTFSLGLARNIFVGFIIAATSALILKRDQ